MEQVRRVNTATTTTLSKTLAIEEPEMIRLLHA
jgi:hypothetical protein